MAQPQQQTFSDVQPIQAAQTFSNVVPIDGSSTAPQGFWDKVQAKLPGSADTGLKGAVNHIQDTLGFLKSTYDVSAPGIAQQIYKKLSGQPNELKELPGKMVTAFALAGEPEAEGAFTPRPEVAAPETAAAGVIKPALSKAGSAATSLGQSLDPDLVGLVSPRAAHALRLASKVGKIATKLGAEAAPEAAAPVPDFWGKGQFGTPVDQWGQRIPEAPVFPGDLQPIQAASKVAQPASLAAPAAEVPAATPTAAAPPVAAPVVQAKKFATLSDLQGQINDALGGKALQPDAPIFQRKTLTDLQGQIKKAVGPAAKPTPKATLSDLQGQISDAAKPPLPQDFTPLPDSSLLKGYKYDPAKQQFSAILNNGESYTHGEVTPEQVKAFEDADSQGSAWTKKIKQGPGTVLVEKNGLPVKKAKALASADGDLTDIVQQSIAKVLAKKGTQ